MECPFCKQEMTAGIMSGDGRSKVFWEASEDKLGVMDKIAGKGIIESAAYSLTKFKLKTKYCLRCKKVILDTDISQ